jgi:hypothetical protein
VRTETAHIWYEPASDVAGIVYGSRGSSVLPPDVVGVQPALEGVELAFVAGELVQARLTGATLERDAAWCDAVAGLVGREVYDTIWDAADAFAEQRDLEVTQEVGPAVIEARARVLSSATEGGPPPVAPLADPTEGAASTHHLAALGDDVRSDAFLAALARRRLLGQRVWSLDVVSARSPQREDRWAEELQRAAADVVDLTVELPDAALDAGPDRLVALLRPAVERVQVLLAGVDEELEAWRARVADAQLLEALRAQTLVPEVAAARPMAARRAVPVGPELVARRLCGPGSSAELVESGGSTEVRIPLDSAVAEVVRRIRSLVLEGAEPHADEPEGGAVARLTYWLLRAWLRTIAPDTWAAPPPRAVATSALARRSVPWDAVFPPIHVLVLDDRGWPLSRTLAVLGDEEGAEVLTARVPGRPAAVVLTCTPHRAAGVTAVGRAELWAPFAAAESERLIPEGRELPGSAVAAPFVRHLTGIRDDLLAVAVDQLGPSFELSELDDGRLARRVDEASRWLGIIRALDAWGPA